LPPFSAMRVFFFVLSYSLACAHAKFSPLPPDEAVTHFLTSGRPLFFSFPLPLAPISDVTFFLNFSDGAPPAAPASVALRVEVADSPTSLEAGGAQSPIELACTRASNSLRLPLLDPRVRRACAGGARCTVFVAVEAARLPAGKLVAVSQRAGAARGRALPDNAFFAAVVAFQPLGAAAEAFFGLLWSKLDEVAVLLLCAPLAVLSQSMRADRLPPLRWWGVLLRALPVTGLWVRALRALLTLQAWGDFYLWGVFLGGALVLHDRHEGDAGAGVGVWVWHAVLLAALLARRVMHGGQRGGEEEGEEEEGGEEAAAAAAAGEAEGGGGGAPRLHESGGEGYDKEE
jgi:hypothetical protein